MFMILAPPCTARTLRLLAAIATTAALASAGCAIDDVSTADPGSTPSVSDDVSSGSDENDATGSATGPSPTSDTPDPQPSAPPSEVSSATPNPSTPPSDMPPSGTPSSEPSATASGPPPTSATPPSNGSEPPTSGPGSSAIDLLFPERPRGQCTALDDCPDTPEGRRCNRSDPGGSCANCGSDDALCPVGTRCVLEVCRQICDVADGTNGCPPGMRCAGSGTCTPKTCSDGACPNPLFTCGILDTCERFTCAGNDDTCPGGTACIDGLCIEDRTFVEPDPTQEPSGSASSPSEGSTPPASEPASEPPAESRIPGPGEDTPFPEPMPE